MRARVWLSLCPMSDAFETVVLFTALYMSNIDRFNAILAYHALLISYHLLRPRQIEAPSFHLDDLWLSLYELLWWLELAKSKIHTWRYALHTVSRLGDNGLFGVRANIYLMNWMLALLKYRGFTNIWCEITHVRWTSGDIFDLIKIDYSNFSRFLWVWFPVELNIILLSLGILLQLERFQLLLILVLNSA